MVGNEKYKHPVMNTASTIITACNQRKYFLAFPLFLTAKKKCLLRSDNSFIYVPNDDNVGTCQIIAISP
jgi:hypothetical protein